MERNFGTLNAIKNVAMERNYCTLNAVCAFLTQKQRTQYFKRKVRRFGVAFIMARAPSRLSFVSLQYPREIQDRKNTRKNVQRID
jgi:hypothetical protein